jgi:DNA repair exonuclease SbcCD nuclease subunit
MSDGKQKGGSGERDCEFRLLCVGDIHLGRRPGRIPEDIVEYGVNVADLTPVAAWKRVVTWAIDNDIDAVVLAGDVVEGLDDRFEAYGHLESGVRKLYNAGIEIMGVAGNHDVQALPRLADHIDQFKLLGRGGNWESVEIAGRSGGRIQLLGWSFPEKHVRRNPLDDPMDDISANVPTIGILHCDVDGGGHSQYAPVPRTTFEQAPGDAWLLGHIHKPDDLSARRPIGYLGSLVGLDPGEPDLHGPWLASISGSGTVEMTQLSLAPLRYERVDLSIESIPDLEGDDLEDAFAVALRSALNTVHDRINTTLGDTRVVACRITLTGRSRNHERVRHILRDGTVQAQKCDYGGIVYFIEKIIDESAPDLDLAAIAKGSDPPALLARRLIHLQEGGAAAQRLVEAATKDIERTIQAVLGAFATADDPVSTPEVHALLLIAGFEALEDLLAQRGSGEGDEA